MSTIPSFGRFVDRTDAFGRATDQEGAVEHEKTIVHHAFAGVVHAPMWDDAVVPQNGKHCRMG